jgi:two-component system response regulator HydG
MSNTQILVVDDDPDVRELLGTILRREGGQVSLACNGQQALALLGKQSFQVLFTDLCMPGVDGLAILRCVPQVCPQVSTVVFTAHAKLDSCIEALRLGACDYVTKPFTPQAIRGALARAMDAYRRKSHGTPIDPQETAGRAPPEDTGQWDAPIVAESQAMREVCHLASQVAPADAAVLIYGERGVGKELLARAIHRQSRRAGGPFVRVNCEAIREADLEACLFGPQWAPFSRDEQVRPGRLQEADGGTVFLSNVEHLPLWAQIQLHDALRKNCAVGPATSRPLRVDVRLIASASRDLEVAVAEGRFCDGLYYLLNVVTIHVPPLRRRREDIQILAESYLARVLARQGAADRRPYRFTEEAWQCLLSHDWPGNLPELANVVARAMAMTDSHEIGRKAIVLAPRKTPGQRSDTVAVPMTGSLREIEHRILAEVIQRCRGNKAAAARVLGLHRRTLYRMLEDEAGRGMDQ